MRVPVLIAFLFIVAFPPMANASRHLTVTQCLTPGQTVTVRSRDALKGEAKRLVLCYDNRCSDEEVTLTKNTFSATVSLRITRECKTSADKKKYGCENGKIRPTARIVLREGGSSKIVTVSKCQGAKLTSALETAIDTGDVASLQELLENGPPRTDVGSVVPSSEISTDVGKQQLIEQLRSIGVTNAEEVARKNPESALDMLRAMANGETNKAQEIARELKLNDGVVKDVGRITDDIKEEARTLTNDLNGETNIPISTFQEPQQQYTPTDIERAKYAICRIESGCNYYKLGPVTRTGDRAYGKYQVMGMNVAQWTCEAGQCMSPQQFLNSPEMQERVFEYKFGQYASQYGYVGAAQAWFGGPGALRNPYRRDQLGTSVSKYAATFSYYFNGTVPSPETYNRYAYNPVIDRLDNYYTPTSYTPSSPFSMASPVADSPQPQYPSTYAQQQPQQQAYTPSQQFQQPSPTVYVPAGNGSASPAIVPVAEFSPVLTLTVETKEVRRGEPLLLSWTSVGTSFGNVKTTLIQEKPDGSTTRIAETRVGSKALDTSGFMRGVHTFILTSKVEGGEAFTEKKDVTIY